MAVARTLLSSLHAGRITGGASTITQQLARRLFDRPRTLVGKTLEALWAIRLTAHVPREQILREYLDRAPMGNTVTGVETAAQFYFRRPAAHLSLGQAALLAGMVKAPAHFDPLRHPDRAHERMLWVLERMATMGVIGREDAQAAAAAPLDLDSDPAPFAAPHFVDHLARSLDAAGLRKAVLVETTLDGGLQSFVEQAIDEELTGLRGRRVGEAAVIVVDNPTGEVLAYAGSQDFFDDDGGQNDGVRALRQPGSTLKPFAYALALSAGDTAATLIPDVEARFATPAGDFQPRNYDRRLHGPVRLRTALANSYNVPAVRVCERIGPARILEVLHSAGFESLTRGADHYGVGLILGDGEVSLYELARAYRGLARRGVLAPLVEIRDARDGAGNSIRPAPEFPARRFLPTKAVLLVTDILSDETARAPAFGLDNALRLRFPVAVKTGTSRGHVDNWTVGFTRARTVAVWVGNFDGAPMLGVSGVTGAGPLFKRVMAQAMDGLIPEPLMDRRPFDAVAICPLSGQRAGEDCPASVEEIFVRGAAPRAVCSMHRRLPRPRSADRARGRVLDVGPAYYGWARGEGLDGGPWPDAEPAGADVERRSVAAKRARFLVPGDGDEYFVDPTLPLADQTIPVRAQAPPGVRALMVRVDQGAVRRLDAPFVTRLPGAPGRHRVELWTPGATTPEDVVSFVVR